MNNLSKEEKKRLNIDLWIIALITMIVFGIYAVFGSVIMAFCKDSSISVWPRLMVAALMEFGIAGLGIAVVCLIRKEKFTEFGLKKENTIKAICGTVLCFLPYLIYVFVSGNFTGYEPLSIMVTPDLHNGGVVATVIGTIIIGIVWGFFEGFNYVVINDKINLRYPSKKWFLSWGALVCTIMGILFHPINTSFWGLVELITTFIALYGMLIVKNKTGNAWGAVFAFIFIWNAF